MCMALGFLWALTHSLEPLLPTLVGPISCLACPTKSPEDHSWISGSFILHLEGESDLRPLPRDLGLDSQSIWLSETVDSMSSLNLFPWGKRPGSGQANLRERSVLCPSHFFLKHGPKCRRLLQKGQGFVLVWRQFLGKH